MKLAFAIKNAAPYLKSVPFIEKNQLPYIDYDFVLLTGQNFLLKKVFDRVKDLNLDESKVILDRAVCVYGFSVEAYQKIVSSKLSIISMNHFGALVCNTLGLPNAAMDFSFSESDFFKFLRNPFRYLEYELSFRRSDSGLKIFWNDIELKFVENMDINSALSTWRNWILNFNPFNLLVVMHTENPEVLAEFDKLPYAKKVCFVPFETDIESGFYVKHFYVGGSSFEGAVNKIAASQTVCFNLWDILTAGKKTSVNLHSRALSADVKPVNSFSHNNINFFNYWTVPKDASGIFWVKFIENNVDIKKNFNIYYPFGDPRFVKRHRVKNKILIAVEDVLTWPWYEGYEEYCLNYVDLALGNEYQESEKYIRLPLWMYCFFPPKLDMRLIKDKIAEFNAARSTCKYECVLISRHDMMNTRTPIYEKLKDILQIKCAGKFKQNTDELQTVYGDNKVKYVHEFMFNICPENCNRFGYVTEKIFHAFLAGAIPIYYGSDNNPEEGLINKDAVLFWDPKSDNEDLVKEVLRLKTDENYYQKFMAQEKLFPKETAEFIYTTFEKLAEKLREM